jgi:hypothetical protein
MVLHHAGWKRPNSCHLRYMWDAFRAPDRICQLACVPSSILSPARDSAVKTCYPCSTKDIESSRRTLTDFFGPLASQVAPCFSNLPLREGPPRAGTSGTPAGGHLQPLVSSKSCACGCATSSSDASLWPGRGEAPSKTLSPPLPPNFQQPLSLC